MNSTPALNSREFQEFLWRVNALIQKGRAPSLSVAVTRHDGLIYSHSFGYADLQNQKLATPETSYLWFSMSKIVTATAVLRLVDEGHLDLDAPISEYVTSYKSKNPGELPRVGQLLNHTAGVANPVPIRWVRPANNSAFNSHDFLANQLKHHGTSKYPIGKEARYSNLGYLMLAQIVSQASQQTFEDYVREQVLLPAGMSRTDYVYLDGADRAVGYVRAPRMVVPLLRKFLPQGIVGDRHGDFQSFRPFLVNGAGYGGFVGDVIDAARLAALHLSDGTCNGKRVLHTETARSMRQIRTPGKPFDFGQGWFRKSSQSDVNPEFVEHYGSGGGFYNAMRLYPDLDQGIVLMANTSASYDFNTIFDLLRRVPWDDR
ncbi:MAG: beta-lactamase family protein [Actinobacteria bacterium]|nr:beta-lactamase family protein [Actinomycetota bacterium]